MKKNCLQCIKWIYRKDNCSLINWENRVKFCSKQCHNLFKIGKPNSSKTKFKKGDVSWCKGLKGIRTGSKNNLWKGGPVQKTCLICNKEFFVEAYRSNTAKTCSKQCSLKLQQSLENRVKMKEVHKERVSKGLHNLYRGYSSQIQLFRKSMEYRLWRTSVFERDNFTCKMCNIRGGRLEADHIKPFCLFPLLALDINNGRTLCRSCHKTTSTYMKNINYYRKQGML